MLQRLTPNILRNVRVQDLSSIWVCLNMVYPQKNCDLNEGHDDWPWMLGVPDWQTNPDISIISYLYRHLQIDLEMSFNSSSTNHYKAIGSYCMVQIVQQHPWDILRRYHLGPWPCWLGTWLRNLQDGFDGDSDKASRRTSHALCGWSLLWINDSLHGQTLPFLLGETWFIAAGMESLDCFERSETMGLNLVSMLQNASKWCFDWFSFVLIPHAFPVVRLD